MEVIFDHHSSSQERSVVLLADCDKEEVSSSLLSKLLCHIYVPIYSDS